MNPMSQCTNESMNQRINQWITQPFQLKQGEAEKPPALIFIDGTWRQVGRGQVGDKGNMGEDDDLVIPQQHLFNGAFLKEFVFVTFL